MHELSLCENILQILEDNAAAQGYQRVKTVWLEVGALSCVEKEALTFCFESVCKDSLAHAAQLKIIPIPGMGHCPQCKKNQPLAQRHDACSQCGYFPLSLLQGDELKVKELEVE